MKKRIQTLDADEGKHLLAALKAGTSYSPKLGERGNPNLPFADFSRFFNTVNALIANAKGNAGQQDIIIAESISNEIASELGEDSDTLASISDPGFWRWLTLEANSNAGYGIIQTRFANQTNPPADMNFAMPFSWRATMFANLWMRAFRVKEYVNGVADYTYLKKPGVDFWQSGVEGRVSGRNPDFIKALIDHCFPAGQPRKKTQDLRVLYKAITFWASRGGFDHLNRAECASIIDHIDIDKHKLVAD